MTTVETQTKPARILSVDMLRGLVIFAMLFANFGFKESPWYMRHYEPYSVFSNATYVDYVFSMFLIMVGISIPLAFRKYGDDWKSNLKLIGHILLRGCSMLFIGALFISQINYEAMPQIFGWLDFAWQGEGRSAAAGVTSCWVVFKVFAVILLFNQLKIDDYRARWASLILRAIGGGMLLYYMIVYVPMYPMEVSEAHKNSYWFIRCYESLFLGYGNWLRGGWWEIIGLIGWAYMSSGLLYMFIRKNSEMIYLMLFFLFYVTISGQYGHFDGIPFIGRYWNALSKQAMLCMLGAGLGAMMLKAKGDTKAMFGMLTRFAIIMLFFSFLSSPWLGLVEEPADYVYGSKYQFLFAINKNAGTMGWIFTTGLFCSLLWMLFYLVCDVLKQNNFAVKFLVAVGSVPLTAYIFQSLFFNLVGITGILDFRYAPGTPIWVSIIVTFLNTVFICGMAVLCKKYKFQLKL